MLPQDIRVATPEDLALLDEHLPIGGIPGAHQQRLLLQQKGKGLYLVAWENRLPVGFVLLHFRHPVHHASHQHYPECAYVEGLNIDAGKQRQGIALALMHSAESCAKEHQAKSIGLSVGIDNAPAQALYRKMGYQHADIPHYQVTWNYLDKASGEIHEEGELCGFWMKPLA
jgi:ribosomal protein S18 acetylase RimI-like enzyme